jgi:hypothetical protein
MKNFPALTLCILAIALPPAVGDRPGRAAALPAAIAKENLLHPSLNSVIHEDTPIFSLATDELWGYLRKGLTYLESPTPQLPPESVAPSYIHPDGRGFGAYGLSPEAYADVQRIYPFFKKYSWEKILNSQKLYDLASRALCDWMLKNIKTCYSGTADKKEIFAALHKAWNLGVGGFKLGREVVPSRARRAQEFLSRNG